jgi:hypothetical protein
MCGTRSANRTEKASSRQAEEQLDAAVAAMEAARKPPAFAAAELQAAIVQKVSQVSPPGKEQQSLGRSGNEGEAPRGKRESSAALADAHASTAGPSLPREMWRLAGRGCRVHTPSRVPHRVPTSCAA